MKWINESTGNRPEVKMKMDPMPKGPYCLIPQHKTSLFEKDPHHFPIEISDEFKTAWGYATYTVGHDFNPLMVAYHFDTSD